MLASAFSLAPAIAPAALAATTATADAYAVNEDEVLTVEAPGVLANDVSDGGTLCVTGSDPTGLAGSIGDGVAADGSFTFTPTANFNGTTSFTYDLGEHPPGTCPETGVQATVTITVTAVNDPPTAAADTFIVLRDRTLNVGAPGVLLNDDDIDGDSITAVKDTNPTHGVVTLAGDGSFSYTSVAGYLGPDAFSYHASDDVLSSPTRVVSLSVRAIPPVATPTPVPTPVPTPKPTPVPPTAVPTPTPEATLPEPSPPPIETSPSPVASLLPTTSPSPSPTASPAPSAAGTDRGIPVPVLLVVVLLAILLAFAAAVYVPKWLKARQDEPNDDRSDFTR